METIVEDFLTHYGVKGMKWGVRRTPEQLGRASRRVERSAKKDAKENARAQMFYGEGAGTRRKLIKNTVAEKSKNTPGYKEAFERHSANQNMSKHVSKAKSERRRKDVSKSTTKTVKGVHRQLTGGFGSVSLASAVIAGAYVGAKKTGIDKTITKAAKKTVKDVQKTMSDKGANKAVEDWLKDQGWY